jgi:hypothetical protein
LIYKYETISELKAKILRILRYSLSINTTNEENFSNNSEIKSIKLFRAFEYQNKLKRSLIKLIYSYIISSKKYRIPGYIISEEKEKIEVNNFFLNIKDIDLEIDKDIIIADIDANFIEVDENFSNNNMRITCLVCNTLVDFNKTIYCEYCKNVNIYRLLNWVFLKIISSNIARILVVKRMRFI